jgi:hypothetical protein
VNERPCCALPRSIASLNPEEGAREAMAGRAARYRFTLTHRFTQPTEGVVVAKQ